MRGAILGLLGAILGAPGSPDWLSGWLGGCTAPTACPGRAGWLAGQDFREHPPERLTVGVLGPGRQTNQQDTETTLLPDFQTLWNCNFQKTCLSAWWPLKGPADIYSNL